MWIPKSGLVIYAALLITGCATKLTNAFGIPQDQWNHMTPQQQNQVVQNYNQQQQIAETNQQISESAAKMTPIIATPR